MDLIARHKENVSDSDSQKSREESDRTFSLEDHEEERD